MTTRKELIEALGARYRSAAFGGRIKILDEFVALTGYRRKHAIRVLHEGSSTATGARARNRLYDEAVRQALTVLWEAADRICGKRLKAVIPMLVDAMEWHGHLDLAPLIKTKVLHVSAATIDRVLAAARLHIDGAGQRRWALPAALPVRSPMQRSRAAARRQSEAVRDARAAASSLDLAAACHSAPDRTRGRRSQVLARPVRGLPQRCLLY